MLGGYRWSALAHMMRMRVLMACLIAATVHVGHATLNYTIREELAENVTVGDIVVDAGLQHPYNTTNGNALQLSILRGSYSKYFAITVLDNGAQVLQTSAIKLDRDDVCPGKLTCQIALDVAIAKPKEVQVVKILISIIDKNDNAPHFPESETVLYISENANPSMHFVLPMATDPDSGQFGAVTYQLISNYSAFDLFETATIHGASELHLVLKERLDHEKQADYRLAVLAKDGGNPSNSATMAVHVIVKDTNDNYPVFEQTLYNVSIKEDFDLRIPFAKVKATDLDSGHNGEIQYALSPHSMASWGNLFGIDSDTGELFLKEELDFESQQVYHLTVTANDKGPDAVQAHAKVILHVFDVNDFTPKITLNFLSSSSDFAEIMENEEPNIFVVHVSVEDLDLGPSGICNCHIAGNDKFKMEPLYEDGFNEYKLMTNASLDRETDPEVTLTIECSDMGTQPLSTSEQLLIRVLDKNDNSPGFNQAIYTANVKENMSHPRAIFQVSAVDKDSGPNANVTYFLEAQETMLLQVDPISGVVSTNSRLDHEKMQSFQSKILAVDHGDMPNTATAIIKIFIDDVNDEVPVFSQKTYNFGTFENQALGTEVGQVSANDNDAAPFNAIAFSFLLDIGSLADTFHIDPESGRITVIKVLDREHIASYDLDVVATNTEEPYHSAMAMVKIHVADKNDNAPTLIFPSKLNNTVHLSVHAYVGYIVTEVMTSDPDLASNAKVKYSIIKGNDLDLFAVAPTTGQVLVKELLDSDIPENFTLLIRVQDEGVDPMSAVATLHIIINKTDEFANSIGLNIPVVVNRVDRKDQAESSKSPLSMEDTIVIIVGCLSFALAVGLVLLLVFVCRRYKPKDKKQETEGIEYRGVTRMSIEDGAEELSVSSENSRNLRTMSCQSPVTTSITMETFCSCGSHHQRDGSNSETSLTLDQRPLHDLRRLEEVLQALDMSNTDSGHGSYAESGSESSNMLPELTTLTSPRRLVHPDGCDGHQKAAPAESYRGRYGPLQTIIEPRVSGFISGSANTLSSIESSLDKMDAVNCVNVVKNNLHPNCGSPTQKVRPQIAQYHGYSHHAPHMYSDHGNQYCVHDNQYGCQGNPSDTSSAHRSILTPDTYLRLQPITVEPPVSNI